MEPETYFAPPQRTAPALLLNEIALISNNPVIDCLLETIAGLFAVLDERRQIVAVNQALLETTGLSDTSSLFGLRPGEALNCIHAHQKPHGCGTTKYCPSCGAAVAIVASLQSNRPQERICAATVRRQDQEVELCFKVRSAPITIDDSRFLLLFIQDITQQQVWAAVEKTFFHDINNILTGVLGTTDILGFKEETRAASDKLRPLLLRLKTEIDLQKVLSHDIQANGIKPQRQQIPLVDVTRELQLLFADHPAANGKFLDIARPEPAAAVTTDCTILIRILVNMLINAFEASSAGEKVRLWCTQEGTTTFFVWNKAAIPPANQRRIFQRHFTTKKGEGHGIGTFSIKLFGEQFLGGKVGFQSSAEHGTTFHLRLPV